MTGYQIEFQVLHVVCWLAVIFLLQVSLLPCLRWLKKPYDIPVSFISSLLLFAVITWYLALAKLPPQFGIIPFLIILLYGFYTRNISLHSIMSGKKWYVIFFLAFFGSLCIKILYNPDIDVSFERYTDHMLLASMMLQPQVPPYDSWYAGGTLTWYYYLAQWPYACLGLIIGVPSYVVYNIIIPTVFGVCALLLYAISTLLLNRYRFLLLATLTLPYPAFFLIGYILVQRGIPLNSLMNGTLRVIPGSITENPLTALFIGSPRAYALDMLNQVFIIFFMCYILKFWKGLEKKERYGCIALGILCLGSMFPMHSWDVLVYGPLVLLCGLIICRDVHTGEAASGFGFYKKWQWNPCKTCRYILFSFFLIIPLGSFLLYLPYFFQMDRTVLHGVAWNPYQSNPLMFLAVFGFFLLVLYIHVRSDLRRSPVIIVLGLVPAFFGFISVSLATIPLLALIHRRFSSSIEILAFGGLLAFIFCEFFSFVDNNGLDRLNTTYKFYFISWFLLSVPVLTIIGKGLETRVSGIASIRIQQGICTLLVISIFIFPAVVLGMGSPNPSTPTLNGMAWIEKKILSEEYNAIQFLRTLPPGEILVEGVSTTETEKDTIEKYFSRVSTFTGIPSILGSITREKLGRNQSSLDERVSDIRSIYTEPHKAAGIMKKYGATILYTGHPEYGKYQIHNPGVYEQEGFTPIWYEGVTVIWRPPG
jgi:YYY domain-containing protein